MAYTETLPGTPQRLEDTGAAQRTDHRQHIPEIDGIRAVAIGLVVVYHIWLNRVSGGVDVFLMLSGLLITLSLSRQIERQGRIRIAAFYARITRRIVPPALFVLVGVIVATLLWLPQVRWRDTLTEVVASALYVENWQLARTSVDYLASQNAASPLQHYWSLAVQGQFYLLWPLLLTAAVVLATRVSVRPTIVVALMCGLVFAGSLAYAQASLAVDPAYAYFDTFGRLWEFALGGLIGFAIPHVRLGRRLKVTAGWVGFVALCACGLIFDGDEFPGAAALWPTLAAGLMIGAVSSGSPLGIDRLLRSAPLRFAGNISYALYLWHWPVLICYLAVTGRTAPSLKGGLMIVGVSVVLAVATRWLIENRLPSLGIGQRTTIGGFALGAAFLVVTLSVTAAAYGFVTGQRDDGPLHAEEYPGAAYLAEGGALPDVPYRPAAIDAKEDRAALYDDGCRQGYHHDVVLSCEFGPSDADLTVALVGGSHSAHWFPALEVLAEKNDWRIVTMIKSSCPFTTDEIIYRGEPYPSCSSWNSNVIDELTGLHPDLVFTTSTRGDEGPDTTPDGYVAQWRATEDLGIPVVAVRDTPWHHTDMPECVEQNGATSEDCGGARATYRLDQPAQVLARQDLPDNVVPIDMTDYVCTESFCPGVIGNVLVYHDAHHLTATYARTLAPYLETEMRDAIDQVAKHAAGMPAEQSTPHR